MTTIVAPQVGTAASPTRRPSHRLGAVRAAAADWLHAYRAAARAQRPTGMDPAALVIFGRD
jgi:hypothetical protein